ncbi:MAG TPA: LamG-like jellyroll fold domain-containing protein, partial [Bryobacteraceae bacterium]|nr:LamG-like jellyroll fold domain-containing protein [Bryobacteraceae bacterium]
MTKRRFAFCGGIVMLFSGLASAQVVGGSATPSGLVEYLPFNETSGTTAHDMSGNNNNGTLTCNAHCTTLPAWTGGARDGALNFTSPSHLVTVPDSASLKVTNQFTFAFWANVPAGAANIVYLQKATGSLVGEGSSVTNGYQVGTGNPGNSVFIHLFASQEIARCGTPASGVIVNGSWQHYAITYDNTNIKIYVNGALNTTCAASVAAGTDATPLTIGGYNQHAATGAMDEVRIYNRALSAQEISGVYGDRGFPSLVSLSLTPALPAALTVAQTQQFVPTMVTTGAASTNLSWSVSPADAGTVSNTGLYTAPPVIAGAQTVTITAASALNPAMSASVQVPLKPAPPLAVFPLSELFGVAWPDQPIEFRYDGDKPPVATTRMMGPLGAEVPYQWVSSCSDASAVKGCIAVRSNLPANANYAWTLQGGALPTAKAVNPVQLNTVGANLEITNGLTGVRIPTAAGNPAPYSLSPIQGIWAPKAAWTGAGATPNFLYSESSKGAGAGCIGCSLRTPVYTATSYTATIVDQGPLKTVVKVDYTFKRPQYQYGSMVINTPGTGHYTVIVTLYSNSKSVVIDEDSDMQLSWYLPIYAQVQPNMARWRGHDSIDNGGNPNPACGYEQTLTVTGASAATPAVITTSAGGGLSNGQAVLIAGVLGNTAVNGTYYAKTTGFGATQFALYKDPNLTTPVTGAGVFSGGGTVKPAYRGQTLNTVSDALQDLTYTADRPAVYQCASGNNPSYQKLLTAYPATSHSAGWYVEMYNSAAGAAAPVVGFYIGRGSKQVYSAIGPSQPGVYTSSNHWITGAPAAGIQVDMLLRGPDNSTPCATLPCQAVVHRNWAIFASTEADLLPTSAHQPIADEQNELTGINLSRLYTYQLVYADPAGGWQPLYMSAAGAAQLQSWVQNGTAICGSPACYATLLSNSDGSPAARALVAMWQGNSAAAVQTALAAPTNLAVQLVSALASGDNRFDRTLGYYGLGLQSSPQTVV